MESSSDWRNDVGVVLLLGRVAMLLFTRGSTIIEPVLYTLLVEGPKSCLALSAVVGRGAVAFERVYLATGRIGC